MPLGDNQITKEAKVLETCEGKSLTKLDKWRNLSNSGRLTLCETILQPGSNCSIRIEKNKAKRRRKHNKCSNLTQNNLVYYCHYCSCRNIKRGTPKGHMKVRYAQKSKAVEESEPIESKSKVKVLNVRRGKECEATAVQMTTEILTIDAPMIPSPTTREIGTIDAPIAPPTTGDTLVVGASAILPPRMEDILIINAPATPPTVSGTTLSKSQKRKKRKLAAKNQTGPENSCAPTDSEKKTGDIPTVDAPATPPAMIGMTLLESKKRKRKKPSSKNQTEPESSCAPTAEGDKTEGTSKRKRKRKSWTSLKEIAQTNEQSGKQNVTDFPIPFSLQGTF
ncbi:uncharacterized protein LOC111008256 isoform X2 [Momordica charantia]|uniref:Uncharacterized protein LOC111008256 isoform X2 n=1 Tax=Momordica charantia TaxID=3673 RepID=A0A6J1C3W9_MOMCH|nr:uncharacterized protein LOC111008256 isoform X2 [Momordica charantia]